ncbi:hypothetical protein [Chlorogloea sp. CCALA 695]|uniref:hypothetical protein n=1 Tax=Chlorogloea sp. CCALA 695 TaxID=2107693 RepID=UPI000D07040C|nr:hypothetical protein [Chlorogloea sp. CCALA 695]PSB32084.1 hypothetical protein C7B70_11145 [Chlorogloea sp. CCALA 695]
MQDDVKALATIVSAAVANIGLGSIVVAEVAAPAAGILGVLGFTTTTVVALPVAGIVGVAGLIGYGVYKGVELAQGEK